MLIYNPQETFAQARERIFGELHAQGWIVTTKSTRAPWKPLKTPYAEHPDKDVRLWFLPQAIWLGRKGGTIQDAHSISSDMRTFTVR